VFDHLSIGVSDLARSGAFYDAVLAVLGYVRHSHNPRHVAYAPPGFSFGEAPFAILHRTPDDARPHNPAFHLAFAAKSRDEVDRFHAAAVAHGGTDDGPPGIRHNYNPGYYAAFVVDPDGYRLEIVLHEPIAS
jgi:catechol 2,3-dioxygenase-like lactoylglutathione lyase family enzyme